MNRSLLSKLFEMRDEKYRDFASALIPNCLEMIGVRIPKLRALAKEICKGDFKSMLCCEDRYFEEVMLRSFVIAYAPLEKEEKLSLICSFVPLIDNWSVCDSFCSSLSDMKKNPDFYIDTLRDFAFSENEFSARFALVCMNDHYLKTDYLSEILDLLTKIRHDGFYVKTAVAWTLTSAYIYDTEGVLSILKSQKLDMQTHNLTVRKLLDSKRVKNSDKNRIRKFRKKSEREKTSLC